MPQNRNRRLLSFALYGAILLGLLIFILTLQTSYPRVDFNNGEQFATFLRTEVEDISELTVTNRQTYVNYSGYYHESDNVTKVFSIDVDYDTTYRTTIQEIIEDYYPTIKIKHVNIYESNIFLDIIISILPIALIAGGAIFLLYRLMGSMNSGNNKAIEFSKSKAKRVTNVSKTFDDVAGAYEEKEELKELVDYLKNPKKYSDMGAHFPKGILLIGPPGTGKTLLAKAVAGEAKVNFFFISGSDFVEMFVGVGASRVRDMFKTAKQNYPCIIFIDEIDAVGRQRGAGLGGGNDEREQTLNQLLVELDGFEENKGILVLAATNRHDILDKALMRPGRFDRTVYVTLPDRKARAEILKVHARNKTIAEDVDFDNIATRTPGFSGAQLENVINEAAILAVRKSKTVIDNQEIEESIDRVIGGPAKKSRIMTKKEREMIATHEAGHALIGLKLEGSNIVQKVTIIPRGDAGGYVMMTPKDDQFLITKGELLAKITGYLAGRSAEEIFFNDISTGAQDDIAQATRIARMMVTELGMSKLGLIQYGKESDEVFLGRDYTSNQRISSVTANEIDTEVREIIEGCHKQALEVIKKHKDIIKRISSALLEKETLTAEELIDLVENKVVVVDDKNVKKPDDVLKVEENSDQTTLKEKDEVKDKE